MTGRREGLPVGLLSSGRDEAAVMLLREVAGGARRAGVRIAYLFVNREAGDSEASDALLREARGLGLQVVCFSSLKFRPELKRSDEPAWNRDYHERAMDLLAEHRDPPPAIDVGLGYLLIIRSPEMVGEYRILNLHPSPPRAGRNEAEVKGHWTDVMWEHIRRKSPEAGAMMHRMTPRLDEGSCATWARVALRGGVFDALWGQLQKDLAKGSLDELRQKHPDDSYPQGSYPLFNAIRQAQFSLETPLVLETLRMFSRGDLRFQGDLVVDREGRSQPGGVDVTPRLREWGWTGRG